MPVLQPTSQQQPYEGLFQQWLNQLPVATSLWQYNKVTPPGMVAHNKAWLINTSQPTETLEALSQQLVFPTETEKQAFQTWWETPNQPSFTGKVSIISTTSTQYTDNASGNSNTTTAPNPFFKLTLSCFNTEVDTTTHSSSYNPLAFACISLTPLCETEALGQAHHEFLSVLSHEFRTPLTSIQGFADTLLQYGNKLPETQQKRCLTLISDQTKRLNRMVENLLSASKLEAETAGKQQAKPVVLQLLLQKVLQTIAGKAHPPHQVTLSLPQNMLPLWGNPDTLEQVLLNLIDNAFKYSPANSTVAIAADITAHQAESQVSLTIQDEGIGLTPQQQDQLFTKFYRASNPLTQAVEGTGLGLYITKVLVQKLGGSIKVAQSTPNKGTCFQVILPLATTQRIQQKMPLLLKGEATTHD